MTTTEVHVSRAAYLDDLHDVRVFRADHESVETWSLLVRSRHLWRYIQQVRPDFVWIGRHLYRHHKRAVVK